MIQLGVLAMPLTLTGIIWVINLYNFMDGSDGWLTLQTLFVLAHAGFVLGMHGFFQLAWAVGALMGVLGVFFRYNRPPARLFMGDAGSLSLGFCLVVMALSADQALDHGLLSWCVSLMWFLVDATVTLIRRMKVGFSPMQPHRQHAFHRLLDAKISPKQLLLGLGGINFVLVGLNLAAFWQWLSYSYAVVWALIVCLALYALIERWAPMSKATRLAQAN